MVEYHDNEERLMRICRSSQILSRINLRNDRRDSAIFIIAVAHDHDVCHRFVSAYEGERAKIPLKDDTLLPLWELCGNGG